MTNATFKARDTVRLEIKIHDGTALEVPDEGFRLGSNSFPATSSPSPDQPDILQSA